MEENNQVETEENRSGESTIRRRNVDPQSRTVNEPLQAVSEGRAADFIGPAHASDTEIFMEGDESIPLEPELHQRHNHPEEDQRSSLHLQETPADIFPEPFIGPTERPSPRRFRREPNSIGIHRHLRKASVAYVIIGVYHLAIGLLIHALLNSYPLPRDAATAPRGEFAEMRARRHLDALTSKGPRVVGSEPHAIAERYIVGALNKISQIRSDGPGKRLAVHRQRGLTGSFKWGSTNSVYENISNVFAVLSSSRSSGYYVLVNCHYDTVVDSPGASDDAINCAIMLEVLQAMYSSDFQLPHKVVFLFNGVEETGLQASHAFINYFEDVEKIKVFINLEACGAGGWEMLFQFAGSPWVLQAYADSAPHPFGTSIAQDVFQSGLIPSDTDFRIFHEHSRIPGIDFAFISNGYVYHTRNDQVKHIPPGCLQRTGENILSTTMALAVSNKLETSWKVKSTSVVYFDVFGFFMVAYSSNTAFLLNWFVFIYVFAALFKRISKRREEGSRLYYLALLSVVWHIVMWIVILVTNLLVAQLLLFCNRQLSYYTHSLNVVWLFIMPSVTAAIAFHWLLRKTFYKGVQTSTVAFLLQEANMIVMALVLVTMTISGLMSSYVPLVCILWPAVCYAIMDHVGLQPSSFLCNMIASILPCFYMTYRTYILLSVFIPIMGRAGSIGFPDFKVAALAALPIFVCLPHHISFVYSHSRIKRLVGTVAAVAAVGIVAVIFTPAGFPFSHRSVGVTTERIKLVHYDRRFYSQAGLLEYSDSKIWYVPEDIKAIQLLRKYAPFVYHKGKKGSCDGVYCGRPYLANRLNVAPPEFTMDFPAPSLHNMPRASLKLTSYEELKDSKVRLYFRVNGPSHMNVYISEKPWTQIHSWIPTSGGSKEPLFETLPGTYFIFHSQLGNNAWEWSLDIEVNEHQPMNSSLVSIGISGHHLHGPWKHSPDLVRFERSLPKWILPVSWTASYDEFIF